MFTKIKIFSFAFVIMTSLLASTNAWAACKPVVYQTKEAVRASQINLYEMRGGNINKASVPAIAKKDRNFPLELMDCGDIEYYFIRRNGTPYMVKQAIFKCITVKSTRTAGNNNKHAGAPGSGSTNSHCPK